MSNKHLFQHGTCIYCGKPADFMEGAYHWRGGIILPPEEEQEDCPVKNDKQCTSTKTTNP